MNTDFSILRKYLNNDLCLYLFFTVLAIVIYFNSFYYGFYLDDFSQVVNNNNVHDLSRLLEHFYLSTVYNDNGTTSGIYYKPIMMMTYSLLWNISPTALPFRIFQIGLHITNAFLIYKVVSQIVLGTERRNMGFLVAIIFLIHPINAEAVLFIADLQEPLYTFFGLILIWTILKSDNKFSPLWFILWGLCSLLSKETGLLYILIGLVLTLLVRKNLLKKYLISMFFILSIYLFLRLGLANLTALKSNDMLIATTSTWNRLITIPSVLMHYLKIYFYPQEITLTQDWIVESITFQNFVLPLISVILILLIIFKKSILEKNNVFLIFSLWFLFGWGLHSQLIPLDGTVSDRWFYFPIIGFTALLILIINNSISIKSVTFKIIFSLICLGLVARTYHRTLDWANPISIYKADLKYNKNSFYLNNNLGLALIDENKITESIPYFQAATQNLKIGGSSWCTSKTNLAFAYYLLKDYKSAIQSAEEGLSCNDIKTYRLLISSSVASQDQERFNKYMSAGLSLYPNDHFLLRYKNLDR